MSGPARLDLRDWLEALRGMPNRWAADAGRYAVREVADGPVRENVVDGPDVNLLDFPAPLWHEHDGGRFIGTGCIVFTSDPATGTLSGGTYRIQVQRDGANASILFGGARPRARDRRRGGCRHA